MQWVNRPNQDFRGFAGTIASGAVRGGDAVRVLPSGRQSRVDAHRRRTTAICDTAVAGQSVTLTLADEIDVSRGDVLAAADVAAGGRRSVPGDDHLDARRADAAAAVRT